MWGGQTTTTMLQFFWLYRDQILDDSRKILKMNFKIEKISNYGKTQKTFQARGNGKRSLFHPEGMEKGSLFRLFRERYIEGVPVQGNECERVVSLASVSGLFDISLAQY